MGIQVSEILGNQIKDIVRETGRRLAQSELIGSLSLAEGAPGMAILFGELAGHFPGESWEDAAATYGLKIREWVATAGFDDLSLFNGAAGIGMAARILSQIDEANLELLEEVNHFLGKALPKEISFCRAKLGEVEVQDYDVSYGLAGIGRFLLYYKDKPQLKACLEGILNYLVQLSEDIEIDDSDAQKVVPGWYISASNSFGKGVNYSYPNGYFDCGLAHGICGPLALFAISLLQGVEVAGQREAMGRIANWLSGWSYKPGMYWPCLISLEEYFEGKIMNLVTRDAWCYGTPGIARSLWLAGAALNEGKLQQLALEAFESLFTRSEASWKAISPTFCHGFSGLLQVTNRMYQDTGLSRFAGYQERLIHLIINTFKSEALFGFYDYDQPDEAIPMNKPGLLEGAAGIALTLLAVAAPIKTDWDSVFLIK